MKTIVRVLIPIFFIVVSTVSTVAYADTILFPIIASNPPNVTTIISVTNMGPSVSFMKYIYAWKPTFIIGGVPNNGGACFFQSFVRTDVAPDVLSFDVSGIYEDGSALFNDPDAFVYGGSFKITGVSPPIRGYLLVSNSDAAGNRLDVGNPLALGGEAVLLDIAFGSAWGYKALNDPSREDFNFNPVGGGGGSLTNVLTTGSSIRFSFFPPNEWTTRFFITPIGDNMDVTDRTARVKLVQGVTAFDSFGVNGRGAIKYAFDKELTVRCTAGFNLTDLLDSTANAALATTGGWGWLYKPGGTGFGAVVYKLEFVVNNPKYGGTNNNGFLLSTPDLP